MRLFALVLAVLAQEAAPARPGDATMAGRVVSADGKSVAGALVVLSDVAHLGGTAPTRAKSTSDSRGEFRIAVPIKDANLARGGRFTIWGYREGLALAAVAIDPAAIPKMRIRAFSDTATGVGVAEVTSDAEGRKAQALGVISQSLARIEAVEKTAAGLLAAAYSELVRLVDAGKDPLSVMESASVTAASLLPAAEAIDPDLVPEYSPDRRWKEDLPMIHVASMVVVLLALGDGRRRRGRASRMFPPRSTSRRRPGRPRRFQRLSAGKDAGRDRRGDAPGRVRSRDLEPWHDGAWNWSDKVIDESRMRDGRAISWSSLRCSRIRWAIGGRPGSPSIGPSRPPRRSRRRMSASTSCNSSPTPLPRSETSRGRSGRPRSSRPPAWTPSPSGTSRWPRPGRETRKVRGGSRPRSG